MHCLPPRRFLAGADGVSTVQQKIADLQADIDSNRQLSTSLAFDAQPRATDAMLKLEENATRTDYRRRKPFRAVGGAYAEVEAKLAARSRSMTGDVCIRVDQIDRAETNSPYLRRTSTNTGTYATK